MRTLAMGPVQVCRKSMANQHIVPDIRDRDNLHRGENFALQNKRTHAEDSWRHDLTPEAGPVIMLIGSTATFLPTVALIGRQSYVVTRLV